MRKIFYFFAAALAAAALSGCARDDVADNPARSEENPGGNGEVTVTAVIASDWEGPETRVGFDDLGSEGVKLAWSAGDCIAMYDSADCLAATFALVASCAGSPSGTFYLTNGDIVDGQSYTVVYPASDSPTLAARNRSVDMALQQGGQTADHLSGVCYMKADYTHSETNVVKFALEFAMLTIAIGVPSEYDPGTHGEPQSMTIRNGEDFYTLRMDGLGNLTDGITVHLLVSPTADAGRTLSFELVSGSAEGGNYVFLLSRTTDIEYKAGHRYTADLSGGNVLTLDAGRPLANFSSSDYPAGDIWVVTDVIDSSFDVSGLFPNLRFALSGAYNRDNNRRIHVVMPNAHEIADSSGPPGIFYSNYAFESISMPVATYIGNNMVYGCSNLKYISFPEATIIGESAFKSAESLAIVNLPKAITIEDLAFNSCSNITSINLPKVEIIGASAFSYCNKLESAYIPEVVEIKDNSFDSCPLLTSVSLPKAQIIGEGVFKVCTSLSSVMLPVATFIGSDAFERCVNLSSVMLPVATSIGSYAFAGCAELTDISLPEATVINSMAFSRCTNLASVSLPSATTIGTYVFQECDNLISLEIATESAGLTETPDYLFWSIYTLENTTLTIGAAESLSDGTDIPKKMWRGMGPFKEIIVNLSSM